MLDNTMYVIRGNRKLNLYIGFAQRKNAYSSQILECAQDKLKYALYFTEYELAEKFLNAYLIDKSIADNNIKYYEVLAVKAEDIDSNIFMYNVPCYYSSQVFREWLYSADR